MESSSKHSSNSDSANKGTRLATKRSLRIRTRSAKLPHDHDLDTLGSDGGMLLHLHGEDNGGGAQKKSEEEGSCASTHQGTHGLDLNQPIQDQQLHVSASAHKNQEKSTNSGDDTSDHGPPSKKIRFDLNQLPPQDEHDN